MNNSCIFSTFMEKLSEVILQFLIAKMIEIKMEPMTPRATDIEDIIVNNCENMNSVID